MKLQAFRQNHLFTPHGTTPKLLFVEELALLHRFQCPIRTGPWTRQTHWLHPLLGAHKFSPQCIVNVFSILPILARGSAAALALVDDRCILLLLLLISTLISLLLLLMTHDSTYYYLLLLIVTITHYY